MSRLPAVRTNGLQAPFGAGAMLALAAALAIAGCAPASPGGAASAPRPPAATTSAGEAPSAAPAPAPATAPAAAPESVKFGTGPSIGSAGVFIGIERGYFQEMGLDVSIEPFSGAAQMLPAIAASQLDVANTDVGSGPLNAIARDLPMRFVADAGRCEKGHCASSLLVRKELVDSGAFKTLVDMRGKSVNQFTPGSTQSQRIRRVLEKAGLQDADVSYQSILFPDILAAMAGRALDVSFQNEPFSTAAVEQGVAVRWAYADELVGPGQQTVIVYSPQMAVQRREVGQRFMVGYVRGLRDYMDAFDAGKDQDAIIGILTRNTSITDPALYKKMPMPTFDPNGGILLDDIKANQQWWVDHGDLPTAVDLDQIYDRTFIDYAVSALGRR